MKVMRYRHVGKSGLVVSAIGLGCNNLGRPGTATEEQPGVNAVVDAALDSGVTFFDVANVYGKEPGLSEQMLGAALKGKRDQAVIGTKFGMDVGHLDGPDYGARGSRSYIIAAVEGSLRRLRTDYIDLYQFHTPDPLTPIEETLRALDDLVTAGKVRYVGHSNRAGWQIAEAEHVARELGTTRFISSQSHYNLIDRRAELEVVPAAQHYDLGIFPYFPLASGLLTGKYSSGKAPEGSRLSRGDKLAKADLDQLRAYGELAKEHEVSEGTLALAWLSSRPQVASVIAGATKPSQVEENAAASEYEPSPAVLAGLDEIFPSPAKVALF
ncbi:Predicted oxidoreductase [Bowdeniella nasicola]|uniref:Predicted oxidoreductase n=2 Tax=Bowdeniella nasicola TaxID=208480 RepID=A0A1H4DRA7_9ACTO|nr:Predicted oxidoreductase [Bowdeniella nasicola]